MKNPYQPAVLQLLDAARADSLRATTPEKREEVAVQVLTALIDGMARISLVLPEHACKDIADEVVAACNSHRAGFDSAIAAALGERPH